MSSVVLEVLVGLVVAVVEVVEAVEAEEAVAVTIAEALADAAAYELTCCAAMACAL